MFDPRLHHIRGIKMVPVDTCSNAQCALLVISQSSCEIMCVSARAYACI